MEGQTVTTGDDGIRLTITSMSLDGSSMCSDVLMKGVLLFSNAFWDQKLDATMDGNLCQSGG